MGIEVAGAVFWFALGALSGITGIALMVTVLNRRWPSRLQVRA